VQAFTKAEEEEADCKQAADSHKGVDSYKRSDPFPDTPPPSPVSSVASTAFSTAPSELPTPPPSPLTPRSAFKAALKKLLDRVVDIKTLQAVDSGYALYNDLSIKTDGISWAFGGLAFVLDWQGNVLTTGNAQFDMAVNIDAPGNVGLDNVSVKEVSARGQDVVVRGKGKIARLNAWARGRGGALGTFRITEDSEEEVTQLSLHQGRIENLGHLTIQESFQHTETFDNHQLLTLGKGARVKGGRAIVNFGTIEGEVYTLQSAVIRN
jgi:hypothetical protein